eukprot:m.277700 g.277700  ORF g.277700 m.277700 type:complete len:176 (-) comp16151_c0_seq1:1908-2435(-)
MAHSNSLAFATMHCNTTIRRIRPSSSRQIETALSNSIAFVAITTLQSNECVHQHQCKSMLYVPSRGGAIPSRAVDRTSSNQISNQSLHVHDLLVRWLQHHVHDFPVGGHRATSTISRGWLQYQDSCPIERTRKCTLSTSRQPFWGVSISCRPFSVSTQEHFTLTPFDSAVVNKQE